MCMCVRACVRACVLVCIVSHVEGVPVHGVACLENHCCA